MIKHFKSNMDFFNTTFYDKESSSYSQKRYGTAPISYTQFFFQERLGIVLGLVEKYQKGGLLIEDGCADGVVIQSVFARFGDVFTQGIGLDISPGMIVEAQKLNKNSKLSFSLKSGLSPEVRADVLLAVGFVSPGIFEDEFSFVKKHLKKDGVLILSLVSRNSIHARLKLRGKEIANDYWDFKKYEEFLSKDFIIKESVPYGMFVPKLWAFPRVARVLQPVFEVFFKFFPSLFHEKLYVLVQKG